MIAWVVVAAVAVAVVAVVVVAVAVSTPNTNPQLSHQPINYNYDFFAKNCIANKTSSLRFDLEQSCSFFTTTV